MTRVFLGTSLNPELVASIRKRAKAEDVKVSRLVERLLVKGIGVESSENSKEK